MMAGRTPVKEALTKVADLSTKSNGQQWKVCARVMKKYDKKVTSSNKVFFKVLVEDDSGKIEALTFGEDNVERMFPLLQCKKVYYISNGRLKEVNKTFENVGHEYEIYLDETTMVTPCSNPADCPTTNSPYTPLCELPASFTPFTDVLGQLTEIGSMEKKIVRDSPTHLLKIQLTDNRDGCKVDVALWGQKAADFKKVPLGKVIAKKNVKVNQYQGRHELSSTLNTQIDYNPSDAEAYILRHHGGTATKAEINEHKPESDQISGSSGSSQKKKFRRIQLPESSQELKSCKRTKRHPHRSCSVLDGTDSDTETVRTDSQETIEYNHEAVNDSPEHDFEANISNNRRGPIVVSSDDEVSDAEGTSNESSSSESDLKDSSLQERLDKANKHPIFQPLSVVFQLLALQAAGEEEAVEEVKQYGLGKIESLDKQIESRLNLCRSQAWCERAATAIHRFPEFVKVSGREDLPRGDFGHLDDCEVCTRDAHPWEYKVYFRGEPYNNLTFSQEDSLADEEDDLELCFKMGRFCFKRTKVYHQLFHWKFHLYQRCKEKLSDVTLQNDKDRLLKDLQTDKSLLLETFNNLKKWIHRITEDYTLDGKELRGNKRYLKEYEEKY